MNSDSGEMVINDVTIIVDGSFVGFSLNCHKDNKVVIFKTEDVPTELLELISQRLNEDVTEILKGTTSLVQIESQFNRIVKSK